MKVYHFLPEKFALNNLKHRRVKISLLNELNDPFELVAANYSKKEQRQIWGKWRDQQIKCWGLVCFSKTWKNPVLWSHYGDRHRGMCLGFNIPDEHLIQVTYTKNRLEIDIERLFAEGKLTKDHMIKLFRTKFIDWKYEREARVYARLKSKDPETGLYFHSFDDQMELTHVYAGPMSQITESKIRANLQPKDAQVKLVKTRLAFHTFDVCVQQRGF